MEPSPVSRSPPASSRDRADVVRTDPFWANGIVENLQITQWDPLFGAFRELSSNPDGPDLPA
jgi:hypothetical protein